MRGVRSAPLLILMLLALLGWQTGARAATPPAGELVKADLLAEPTAIAPGQTFWVGVRLRMKEHWHTYWRNPGDSGEATAITWQLPDGFKAGPIQWPMPHRIPVGPLANYGYDGEVVLLTQITAPTTLASGTRVPLAADVTWLVCEKECIPGEARLSLTLPAAASGSTPDIKADTRTLFEAARATLPQTSPWPANLKRSDGRRKLVAQRQPSVRLFLGHFNHPIRRRVARARALGRAPGGLPARRCGPARPDDRGPGPIAQPPKVAAIAQSHHGDA
jgi:DsbC/DsbD-like thiol-disulfide interchange protein